MGFKVGDIVRWVSQSAGVTKEKVGEVVAVVPAFKRPSVRGCGLFRDHESYEVRVLEDNRNRKYWPRVSQLQLADKGGL